MMKNFTKILLGLFALAAYVPANAWEWREVSKTDFGGNDDADPVICKTQPSDMNTGLGWYGWDRNYSAGQYMIVKATHLADCGRGANLTNWGDKLPGAPRWAKGGDHTNPSDPNKGYFMAFDCDFKTELKLYTTSLPISCSNVEFKLEAYFAALDYSNPAQNLVEVSIESGGTPLQKAQLDDTNSEWRALSNTIKWIPLSTTFSVSDPAINSIDFVLRARNCTSVGYDIALDDITISVHQPTINFEVDEFRYQQPAALKVSYLESEFSNFFSGSSSIEYQWYKFDGTKFNKVSGANGSYTAGSNIELKFPSFDKDNDNGTYRIVIGSTGTLGDGNSQNLCVIQKDTTIAEERNVIDVTLCEDSTKTIEGITVSIPHGISKQDKKMKNSANKEFLFQITSIIPTPDPDPVIEQHCLDGVTYTSVGQTPGKDIITYSTDEHKCPIKIKKTIIDVSDVIKDSVDICEGVSYKADEVTDRIWTWSQEIETNGEKVSFNSSDGCAHERYVFVHPKKSETVDFTYCAGTSYSTDPIRLQTYKWGCDSVITPNIIIVQPKVVNLDLIKCPSEKFELDGVIYDRPTDVTITHHDLSVDECDSTTNIHLVVMDGGEVEKDTLICREQILFGKEYTKKGEFRDTIHHETEYGCAIDTIWNIKVVEVTLNLRLFNNQSEVCEGQPISMTASLNAYEPGGTRLYPDFHWEPELEDNRLDPTLFLEETTEYTIYADLDLPSDIDKNAKGCHAKESRIIKVNPMPKLSVDSVNPDDRSVQYTVTDGTMPYHMYLGSKDLGITESNDNSQDHLPYGKHILQVKDSTGCIAEETIVIEATKLEPNTFFTPNGDGENDYWKVKNIDVYPTATVKVFDRYGKLLHSGTGSNFEEGWDGTYNGNKMPATDYWYEIDIDEIDTQYYGHFTLMR